MPIKIIYKRVICGLIIAASLFFPYLFNANVSAAPLDRGLTLSPLRSEIETAPGTSIEGFLTVTNSTKKPMDVAINAEAFSIINQQYDYAFTAESRINKWVTFSPNEITIGPGKNQKIQYNIGVPLSAEPGGRYISLFASTSASSQDGVVQSRQRIASLIYITVTGDVSRDGHLVSLTSPWGVFSDKSDWSLALQNTGTTHFRSRYNVKLQNILWGTAASSMSGDKLVLPGTVRAVSDKLPLPQWPGVYKIVYTIGLGDTPAVSETRLMLYLPPLAILSSVATIVIIVLAFRFRRKSKTDSA